MQTNIIKSAVKSNISEWDGKLNLRLPGACNHSPGSKLAITFSKECNNNVMF
jgi:hypothetical protein